MSRFAKGAAVSALALAVSTFACGQAGAQDIGVAAAVNPSAFGIPPGAATRTITIGTRVVFREKVRTGASGAVQILFPDKSALQIGPNSEMTIDEFAYDPAKGAGKMTLSLGRGVMRFIGGEVSHKDGATIRTPAATIGVRGVTAFADFSNKTLFVGNTGGGVVRVANQQGSQDVPPNSMTSVAAGGAPTQPITIPLNRVATLTAGLNPRQAQKANAPNNGLVTRQLDGAQRNEPGRQTAAALDPGRQSTQPPPPTLQTPQETQRIAQQAGQTNASLSAAADTAAMSLSNTGYLTGVHFRVDTNSATAEMIDGTLSLGVDSSGKPTSLSVASGNVSTALTDVAFVDKTNFVAGFKWSSTDGTSGTGALYTGASLGVGPGGSLADLDSNSSATACVCAYLNWGLWTASDDSANPNILSERFGSWVAGTPTTTSAMQGVISQGGTATYNGHVLAMAGYGAADANIVAGSFQSQVNFGARTGTFSVGNLDGASYAGSLSFGGSSPASITGSGFSSASGRSIGLGGSFYSGGGDAVSAMGGPVSLSGPGGYVGAGTYAASR